jgi:hypothetical protein
LTIREESKQLAVLLSCKPRKLKLQEVESKSSYKIGEETEYGIVKTISFDKVAEGRELGKSKPFFVFIYEVEESATLNSKD